MRNFRFSVLASIAIVLAVSGAFMSKLHAEEATKQATSYYWFNASSGAYHTQNTATAERTLTGCQYTAIDCEKGYNSNQLVNPAQPSQGVKPGEMPQVIIRKN